MSFNGVGASAPGLPNSTGTVLPAGVPQTVNVSVTNPGPQPILVGADPRLKQFTTLQPVPIQDSTTFALPPDPAQEPIYVVPPNTKSLTVSAFSTTPAQWNCRVRRPASIRKPHRRAERELGWSVDPTNNGFGSPVQIGPNETKTITLTITPSGKRGTVVRGVLNLVTVSTFPSGFTALPQVTPAR